MSDIPSIEEPEDPSEGLEPVDGEKKVKDDELQEEIVLTPDEQDLVEEVIFIGRKEKVIDILGHSIHIKTLDTEEELKLALLIKEWEGTQGFNRAYKAAVFAACVVSIDDAPIYAPLSSSLEENNLVKKFEKVKKFYPVFIDMVYKELSDLEATMGRELLEKLGK